MPTLAATTIAPAGAEGLLEGGDDEVGDLGRLVRVGETFEQHQDPVAAQSGGRVRGAQAGFEAAGNGDEDLAQSSSRLSLTVLKLSRSRNSTARCSAAGSSGPARTGSDRGTASGWPGR